MRASFFEANPAPVKAVLAAMGRMGETLRLPLAPLTDATRQRVFTAYQSLIDATRV